MTANNISSVYAVFGDHPRALAWAPNARSSPTSTNTISVLASLPWKLHDPHRAKVKRWFDVAKYDKLVKLRRACGLA